MELIQKEFVAQVLANLVRYGIDVLELNYLDGIYAHNQLIELFDIQEPCAIPESFSGELYANLLNPLCEYALQNKMIETHEVERFKAKIMGFVMPSPSAVIDKFDTVNASKGIRAATTWLFKLSTNSAYINLPLINKNMNWKYPAKDGDLVITINTARPEKDPKEIALAAQSKAVNYPNCLLCLENLGYTGRINHPARQNLRYIPIPLEDDSVWYLQFSPYRYFDEHCIFFNEKHAPMELGEKSFARMVELLRNVPHYFVGSNAPLPIVGGSILAHDHYQGGAKEMPEFRARPKMQFYHPNFPDVKFSIVNWYNSVIRIKSRNPEMFVKAMVYVNDSWATYSDPKNGILAHTTAQHNAITPVVHLERGEYYAELFLRNNRTDEKHPYGIFHPTEELHHIKKEGIGVIEVMGTFILPGRLSNYLYQIRRYVSGVEKYNEAEIANPAHPLYGFRKVIKLLMTNYNKETLEKADKCLLMYISQKCEEVLRATAVFKSTSEGLYGFMGFMRAMGMENSEFRDNNNRKYQAQKRVERNQNLGIENTPYMREINKDSLSKTENKSGNIAVLVGDEEQLLKNIDNETNQNQVVSNEENKDVVVPKKRGRKPKNESLNQSVENPESVESSTADITVVNVEETATVVPKKRGRKPKSESQNQTQSDSENAETVNNEVSNVDSSNGEGNVSNNESVQSESQTEEPVKRKRGRPRKVVE